MPAYEALYYSKANGKVRCVLCPHKCNIKEGNAGTCRVRYNNKGILYSNNYGKLSAINFDPIEKKPLYHFYPGRQILSIGSIGCNLKCKCCQNWQISQSSIEDFPYKNSYQPFDIVEIARSRPNNIGVAYTYNEPTVWYEFMHDTTKLIAQAGLKNVIVSNGYINEEPLLELLPWIHAVNIDLKGFTEDFYKTVTGAQLEPVKKTLTILAKSNVHFEITNLVIPGSNDDEVQFIEMIDWIADLLGKNTILHLSRYFPMYRMKNEATSPLLLEKLYALARKRLFYVYVGNIQLNNYQDTKCNQCGHIAVVRSGYSTELSGIDKSGRCKYCGNIVIQDI